MTTSGIHPGTCIDNKPQNRGQLSNYSNRLVSNNICHICGGDHNVLVIGLENGGRIVTPPFLKHRMARVRVPNRILSPNIFWLDKAE